MESNKELAGAELCQTHAKVGSPAVADLITKVEFHIRADFQLFSVNLLVFEYSQLIASSSIKVPFIKAFVYLPSLAKLIPTSSSSWTELA